MADTMKLVKTIEAEGAILCHDITQIIPNVSKGPVFKKGHIVTKEDIPVLLSVGKENLYVWEAKEGMMHEDDAAEVLRMIVMGEDPAMYASDPSEGKISIYAACDGLLTIRRDKLTTINSIGQMMIATIAGDRPVHKGDMLAGTRVIPLVIEEVFMNQAKEAAGETRILSVLPYKLKKYALVITGNEVATGRIADGFAPVLESKMSEYDTACIGKSYPGDDRKTITNDILKFADAGADIILCSGGMSVDPDDRTPGAIKDTGAKIISYGAPVLPGAMFLLSYLHIKDKVIPVLGVPGCAMYNKRTILDLVLPRILAGQSLTARDLAAYGEGGLCRGCDECRFPNCSFGI